MVQEIADSKLLNTWGSSGVKIEPDISKIIEGWQLGEQPPHEYMNWLQNTFGSKLNHILKNGVVKWNDETEYLADATIQHNGSIWICQETNANSEPTELNNNWDKIPSIENLALTVDTIDDFPAGATTGDTCIVKDLDRGGIFIYDSTKVSEHNDGTNFNGWIRQYSGAVNVKWFGAKGDGITDDSAAIASCISTGLILNGDGLTYKVASIPDDFSKLTNIAFIDNTKAKKVTKDFFDYDVRKITNGGMYTAWAQDKAYVLGTQIRVWLNEADSHQSSIIRPILYFSDDGGASYSAEYLDETLQTHTTFSAGTDGVNEYVFVQDVTTLPATHYIYRRPVPTTNYESSGWTILGPVSYPMPSYFAEVRPTMIHSFSVTHDGGFVVGMSDGNGTGFAKSLDYGATFTFFDLLSGTNQEEPTIKYDPASQRYMGFIRAGDAGNNPKFWISAINNLASITYYDAPSGYFGVETLEDCPIPLQIVDGKIYATVSYRNGIFEGNPTDEYASTFIIMADVSNGDNIWSHADTYRIGHSHHAETGGASALGVGSVVHFQDKILMFFGEEERTGAETGYNRRANIFQLSIPLSLKDGVFDFRNREVIVSPQLNVQRSLPDGRGTLFRSGSVVFQKYENLSATYGAAVASNPVHVLFDSGSASGLIGVVGDGSRHRFTFFNTFGSCGIESNGNNLQFTKDGVAQFRWDAPTASLRPEVDNVNAIGGALKRWSVVYAATGTINTSDDREKTYIDITEAEKQVAVELKANMKKFKFNDAIESKGKKARLHFGTSAQTVKSIFEKYGLNGFDYAILCYDEWEEQEEVKDEEENIIESYSPAGSRYGIRYEELLCFIISAM